METVKRIDPADAMGKTRELFAAAAERLGVVPNMLRVMGHSPELLGAYLDLNRAIHGLAVPERLRILIAAAVAEATGCDYGVSFSRGFAMRAGLPDEDFDSACRAEARDPRTDAALRFVAKSVENRGHLPASEVEALRQAGFGEREIVEIIGLVGVNLWRNYFNLLAGTPVESATGWAAAVAAG
ncbi:MAG: carboxymuconolactone decarboxylase family protein [Acidobacteriota bacterium]